MSQILLLAVGKLKLTENKSLCQNYLERLSHYTKFEMIEVPDASGLDPDRQKIKESESLVEKIKAGDFVILLDETGKEFTSRAFAEKIQSLYNAAHKRIVFVMGGAYGLSDALKKRGQLTLALSQLTLPHELARVVFLEQLYRAHTILKGEKYHH